MWKLKHLEAKLIIKPQVSGKASLTPESTASLHYFAPSQGRNTAEITGPNPSEIPALLRCVDLTCQHSEWDAVLIVLAFFHDHLGDTSLFISFNVDTKLEDQVEGQVDNLSQHRPAGK